MNFRYNKKLQAFTLVELLIVLIIIGVLAGGLWLAFGGSDAKAQETACLGNRETIKTAWSMHKFANGSPVDLNTFVTNSNYKEFVDSGNCACPTTHKAYTVVDGQVYCEEHSSSQAEASVRDYIALKDADTLKNGSTAEILVIMDSLNKLLTEAMKDYKIDFNGEFNKTRINEMLAALSKNEAIAKSNIKDFLTTGTGGTLSDYAIGLNSSKQFNALMVKSGNDVYVVYANGAVYYCANQHSADSKSYLADQAKADAYCVDGATVMVNGTPAPSNWKKVR
ncbi:MAG: type II secretion system protein [Cloacibacillus sp.]